MTHVDHHRALRDAFGQFATGVAVVTARNPQGLPIGITVNSFASVSLEPALVSWCVDKESFRYQELVQAENYTISVLAEDQISLSDHFAQRSWDDAAFDEIDWQEGVNNVPQLKGVAARFHCKRQAVFQGGDHDIIIGEVDEYENNRSAPLIFFQGSYQSIK